MAGIPIVVLYDGEWVNQGGKFTYKSNNGVGIIISPNSTYEELHDSVCRELDINPSEVSVKMKFTWNSCQSVPPIEVVNDKSTKFFCTCFSDVTTRSPLCISVERKLDSTAGLEVGDEVRGKPTQCDKTVVESVQSRNPIFVQPTVGNEDAIGLENFGECMFDHNGSEDPYCSTSPPLHEASAEHRLQNPSLTSSIRPTTSGYSIDSLFDGAKDVKVGDFFSSKEELNLKLKLLAVSRHFQTRAYKSTKDLLVLKCYQNECKWRLRATRLQGSEAFRVRKYCRDHTCSLDSLNFNHRQGTSKLIGHCIKSKYEGTSQCYRPNDIIQDMKKKYGMTCTYNKAWRAREIGMALARGTPEQSYSILPLYCAMLEMKNPGTSTYIETDASNRFKYFFMSLGACIGGFRSSIRPVIAVDGTFLKSKH